MRLRNADVYARCDERGTPIAKNGRVEIRYKRDDGRAYFASAANLMPSESDSKVEPDDFCGPGEAVQNRARASKVTPASPAPEGPKADELLAYADGACSGNPGPAGVGVIAMWDDETRELSEYIGEATNNIAELTGILRAIELARELGRPLRLYTDSKYSIGVLTQGWKARANQALVAEVRRALDAHGDVELFHVRGHQGVRLNEHADELAVRAIQNRASTGWTSAQTAPPPRSA